jgi:hypothetical protein
VLKQGMRGSGADGCNWHAPLAFARGQFGDRRRQPGGRQSQPRPRPFRLRKLIDSDSTNRRLAVAVENRSRVNGLDRCAALREREPPFRRRGKPKPRDDAVRRCAPVYNTAAMAKRVSAG